MLAASASDVYYMSLAINEAKKGLYTTRPNPAVGSVIVKDGRIVSTGYHAKAGTPHAEAAAIAAANPEDLVGATAYVTLEPCSHTGRTPPCADALIKARVARVVIACMDTNPLVAGNGVAKLKAAGIEVLTGVCRAEAAAINRGFLKAMATAKPYVRLKIATSLDGRTAMANGESKWITSPEAREDVQRLRALSGAIITGSGTIINDNPALNVRSHQLGVSLDKIPQPMIAVLDRSHRLTHQSDYQVFQSMPNRVDTLLWRDDIHGLLDILAKKYQCHDVLVEAGAGVTGAFIQAGLVDELIIYQAPCLLGSDARAMADFSLTSLSEQQRFSLSDIRQIGTDIRLTLHSLC